MLQIFSLAAVAVFPALVIGGAVKDLTSFTIPNWLTGGLAVCFAPAALLVGLDVGQIGLHVAVGLAFLLAGMAMFALGWIGGGDAKLFAAAALWLGWPAGIAFLFYTTIAGGALALCLLGARSGHLGLSTVGGPTWVSRLLQTGGPAPYGVAIAVGALAAFRLSPFLGASKTALFGV